MNTSKVRGKPSILALYLSAISGTLGHAMFIYGLVVVLGDQSEDSARASLAYAVSFGIMAIMTPIRGFLGDVVPIAPLVRKCMFGMATAVFAFSLALWGIDDAFALFLASVFLGGLYGYASGGVAGNRVAMIPLITNEHAKPTIILSMMTVFGFTFGPIVYALLRVNFDDQISLLVVALLLLGSAIFLPRIDEIQHEQGIDRPPMWQGILDGVRNIVSNRPLWSAMLLGVVPTFFILGPVQAVLPEFISQEFPGAEIFRGTVFVALGIGTLCGGIASTFIAKSPKRQLWTMLAGLLACIAFSLLLIFPGRMSLLSFTFLCGAALGIPHSIVPVLLQDHVDSALRARTMAALTLKLTGLPALGAALCGMVASALGSWDALLVFSLFGLIVGVILVPLQMKPLQNKS